LIPNENNGNHTKLRNSTNLQLDIKVGHKLQLTIVKNNNKVFARQGPRSRQMEQKSIGFSATFWEHCSGRRQKRAEDSLTGRSKMGV